MRLWALLQCSVVAAAVFVVPCFAQETSVSASEAAMLPGALSYRPVIAPESTASGSASLPHQLGNASGGATVVPIAAQVDPSTDTNVDRDRMAVDDAEVPPTVVPPVPNIRSLNDFIDGIVEDSPMGMELREAITKLSDGEQIQG